MPDSQQEKLKALFLQAAALPATERAGFLDEACAGDADLRREADSLLANHIENTIIDPSKPTPSGTIPGGAIVRPARIARRHRHGLVTIAIVLVLLALTGVGVRIAIKDSLNGILDGKLRTILDADVLALEIWIDERLDEAQHWAADPRLRETNPTSESLIEILAPFLDHEDSAGAGFIDAGGVVVANTDRDRVGQRIPAVGWSYMERIFDGHTVFVRPYRVSPLPAGADQPDPEDALIAMGAPVRSANDEIFGALILNQPAEGDFTRILQVGRMGESGETYVFDKEGVMLSESRFTDDLVEWEAIPWVDEPRSALAVEVRDPGGNLYQGHVPNRESGARPLTKLAALAIASRDKTDSEAQHGILLEPYRDYRGVNVIGAWRWLPEYGFGIAVEIDAIEAFAPLRQLDLAFGGLFGLLSVASVAYLFSSMNAARLRQEVADNLQLGGYTVVSKIGQGGMGEVYLAWHGMMKRQTAIKMLKPEFNTPEFEKQFEREVQLACRLNHPATIAIYDYGKTDDGRLYYAMEYLDGEDLYDIVRKDAPLPAGRVIHILTQLCGALQEAHDAGLIHRDIKPRNIMLCARGGLFDVAKLLDFGLVKDVNHQTRSMDDPSKITGTPVYMAPERIQNPSTADARVDLYSLGAVAYFLLTGKTVFPAASDLETLMRVVEEEPVSVGEATETAIPPGLKELVMQCLSKDPASRPQSAREIGERLAAIATETPWSSDDAEAWWQAHGEAEATEAPTARA